MITLIGFGGGEPCATQAIARRLGETLGDVASVEITAAGDVVRIIAGNERVAVVPRPTPIHAELLAGPVNDAWYWPQASAAVSGHGNHLIVANEEQDSEEDLGSTALRRALLLTRVSAELLAVGEAKLVYWDSATQIHAPDVFRQAARACRRQVSPSL